MKKWALMIVMCMLCTCALAEGCSICGGDTVCDTCAGLGYQEMPAYGGGMAKVACVAGCLDGACPDCKKPCEVCGSDGLCDTCSGLGYQEMPAYGGGMVKVACMGENCADGKCTACGTAAEAAPESTPNPASEPTAAPASDSEEAFKQASGSTWSVDMSKIRIKKSEEPTKESEYQKALEAYEQAERNYKDAVKDYQEEAAKEAEKATPKPTSQSVDTFQLASGGSFSASGITKKEYIEPYKKNTGKATPKPTSTPAPKTTTLSEFKQKVREAVKETKNATSSSQKTTGRECTYCDGDGKCNNCGGDMWVWKTKTYHSGGKPYDKRVNELCQGVYCNGGKCSKCGGTGRLN